MIEAQRLFYAILNKMVMALVNNNRFLHPKLPLKCFKLLSRQQGFLIMLVLMQVTEIYTLNSSNSISVVMTTYHHVMMTTTSASISDKKKPLTKKEVVSLNNEDDMDEDSEEIYDDKPHLNYSANGMIVGSYCESTCDRRLINVFCNPLTKRCECEKNYPVKIGPRNGCAKSKRLGEQCFYDQACFHNDENSVCMQINHNAICDCREGFHIVTHQKPTRKTFCTPDYTTIASDLPALLGVIAGIFTLAGLICMVLHLFSKNKYPRTRTFADAHAGPPVFFASDTGIPLTIQSNRPSSRSSQRSNESSIGSYGGRRSSGILHKGVNVSQSRQGSARSAAILLYSYQLNALRNNSTSPKSRSDEFMAKYIEQQLEDQKRLLYLEIPALRNHSSLMRKLRLNLRSESDLSQLDTIESAQRLIFNSPVRIKLKQKFFKRSTAMEMTEFMSMKNAVTAVDDERSGVNETNMCLYDNDIPRGLISNPMAYSLNDLDDDDDDDDDQQHIRENEKSRKYIIDNEEIFIGALPSPASEYPSIATVKIDVSVNHIICFTSRRTSLASVHSTTSSIRSYSSRRFDQELRDKELRQEMKKQLCRLQEQQQLQKMRPQIIIGDQIPPFTLQSSRQTPHILTPNSTDELLPSVEENDEFSPQFDRKNP